MVDRNRVSVEQFKLRGQQLAFAKALADGRASTLDNLGRPLVTGDVVHLDLPQGRLFQVMEIAPELSPNVPPGTLRVVLVAQVTVHVPAGHPCATAVLVQPAELANAEPPSAPVEMPVSPPTLTDSD